MPSTPPLTNGSLSIFQKPGNTSEELIDQNRPQLRPKEDNKFSPFTIMPKDLILYIFSLLASKDLDTIYRICQAWRALFEDPSWISKKNIQLIDRKVWKDITELKGLGLSFENLPFLDLAKAVEKIEVLLPLVEKGFGVTILAIPQGFTLKKLEALAQSSKAGVLLKINILPEIRNELQKVVIKKPYRVAIANSILMGSRNLLISEQCELLKKDKYEIPGLLETITLMVLKCLSSKKEPAICVFNDLRPTSLLCRETIKSASRSSKASATSDSLPNNGFSIVTYVSNWFRRETPPEACKNHIIVTGLSTEGLIITTRTTERSAADGVGAMIRL